MSTQADIQAKEQLANAHQGIQKVLQQQGFTLEVLEEEVNDLTAKLRAVKVVNKTQGAHITQVVEANQQLADNLDKMTKNNESNKAQAELERQKYQSLVWHLKQVTGRDIDEDYLRQTYDQYLAELDEQKRTANKQEVAAAHAEAGLEHKPAPESTDEATRAVASDEEDAPGNSIENASDVELDSTVERKLEVVPGIDPSSEGEPEIVHEENSADLGDHAEVEVSLDVPKPSAITRASEDSSGGAARKPKIKQHHKKKHANG